MTKTKFAIFVFALAFGLNIFAFVFFRKNWQIEENKTVWLYELPKTPLVFDSGHGVEFSPQQALIGTLFVPPSIDGEALRRPEQRLAKSFSLSQNRKELIIELGPQARYENTDPILVSHWIESWNWVRPQLEGYSDLGQEWESWIRAELKAEEDSTNRPAVQKLVLRWANGLNQTVSPEKLVMTVLSHPLSGVIHPDNLEALKRLGRNAMKPTDWISSGAYRIRKWRPKEIVLFSREGDTYGIEKGYFRVLKFQSAPVKNPSAHYLQARATDAAVSDEHRVQKTGNVLNAFWICRSWKEAGTICNNAEHRKKIYEVLQGKEGALGSEYLKGLSVRVRIPEGSEVFREELKAAIHHKIEAAGGSVKPVSFFFENSEDADIELMFTSVVGESSNGFAPMLVMLNSRMQASSNEANLFGKLGQFELAAQAKEYYGKLPVSFYSLVFISTDLNEHKMPF